MDIDDFHSQLQSDVVAAAVGAGNVGRGDSRDATGETTREEAFTQIVADDLSIAGVLEAPIVCHYEGGSGSRLFKVNGCAIPEDDTRLDLFVTIYSPDDEVAKINTTDVERAFQRLQRYFMFTHLAKFLKLLEPGSEAYAMASDIHARHRVFDRIHLMIFTNTVLAARKEAEPKQRLEGYTLTYDIWDLERLRRLRQSNVTQEPINIDLTQFVPEGIRCVSGRDKTLGYDTCVAMIPGTILRDLYDDFGGRLLELNVRSYLQARGKVNKGILQTLIQTPERFLAYNNGITVVAESVKLSEDGTHLNAINGMQIVNGGQTTASIHRASKEHGVDLAHVYVQVKLTVVPADKFEVMVPEISRYSNTQNKVSEVDLGANHPFHIGVERVSRRQWAPGEQSMWFYERARGSYQTERARRSTTTAEKRKFDGQFPPNQRFSKEDLARYVNAWDGLPHIVSRGGQKNFLRFMEGLPDVSKDWEPDTETYKGIVGKAIMYRETQAIARRLGVGSFRVNIVTYTVSIVADATARRVDLKRIWEIQGLTPALARMITDWMIRIAKELVGSVGARNPTEWFKLEQCWKHVRDACKTFEVPNDVQDALVQFESSGVALTHSTANDIARCMALSANDWFRIQVWGNETGKLEYLQIGIANTLSGYASKGWKKQPSVKQAKHGVAILEIVEKEGVLST